MEFINYEPTSMVNSPWNPTKDDPAVNRMNYVSFSARRTLHEQPLHAHGGHDISSPSNQVTMEMTNLTLNDQESAVHCLVSPDLFQIIEIFV